MEGWKSFGVFLTGFAAVMTAVTALLTYVIESGILAPGAVPVIEKKQANKNQQLAVINDLDGWVNVREFPNTHSRVLVRLENKARVFIVDKKENWYRIRTENDIIGYIYFDRLELIFYDHFIKK